MSLRSWFSNVTHKDILYHLEIKNHHSDVTERVEYIQPFTHEKFEAGAGRDHWRFTKITTVCFSPYSILRLHVTS